MTYLSVDRHTFEAALRHEIIRTRVGSQVYGTNLNDEGDEDLMGVTVMPPTDVLGMSPFESLVWRTAEGASVRSGPGDTDLAIYSLNKFLKLSADGNPSILTLYWTPQEHLEVITPVGLKLRAHKNLFVTKTAGRRFAGYMEAQRSRMIDSRAGVRAPRTNRPELIEKYGFDTKFAMHMIRLGYQGIDLIKNGEMVLPDPHADFLKRIRLGDVPYEHILDLSYGQTARLEAAIEESDLPERPDPDELNELSVELHRDAWGF